jgi:hypothetical protein
VANALIADIIPPQILAQQIGAIYADYLVLANTGAVMVDPPGIDMSAGKKLTVPRWKRLDDFEAMSETGAFTRSKIQATVEEGYVVRRGKSFGVKDTATLVSKADPAQGIREQLARKFAETIDSSLVSVLKGAIPAANRKTVGVATGALKTIEYSHIVRAAFVLGDNAGKIKAVAMHSAVLADAIEKNLVTQEGSGEDTRYFIMGKPIFVSDRCPVDTSGANPLYTTFLLGTEAMYLIYQQTPEIEYDRDIEAKTDIIVPAVHFLPHLIGTNFTATPANDVGPTEAELATTGNWALAVEQTKSVRAVALVTNATA